MATITKEMYEYCYEIGKMVYLGKITQVDGKCEISSKTEMFEGSANDYISAVVSMLEGNVYKRTIKNAATAYYLDSILQDFGVDKYKKSLKATKLHTAYYSRFGHGHLTGVEKMVEKRLYSLEP